MSFKEIDLDEAIERQRATDPVFREAWDKAHQSENKFFKDTMTGLCEAVAIERSSVCKMYRRDKRRWRKLNKKHRQLSKKLHLRFTEM